MSNITHTKKATTVAAAVTAATVLATAARFKPTYFLSFWSFLMVVVILTSFPSYPRASVFFIVIF